MRPSRWRVYPRTDGGTEALRLAEECEEGLSPHRRGNHRSGARRFGRRGSIPAQTGEPAIGFWLVAEDRVYPRTDGGTTYNIKLDSYESGLSPHRRGNPCRFRLD